ncbi:MAG: HAD hydrolase-like protein [Limisphaerales bacterium]
MSINAIDSKKPPVSLVILDMAGTIVWDGEGTGRCLGEAFSAARITVTDEQLWKVAGFSKPSAIRSLLAEITGGRPEEEWVTSIHDDFVRRMIEFYRTQPAVAEMPGATELLKHLKEAGVRVALDTGCSRVIVDAVLDRLGWHSTELIDATVANDEVARGRPHPDLILEAMRKTGISDVTSTAKVGDTPTDLLQGMAAGCGWVVGVTHGTHSRAQLAQHPHTHLVASLGELPEIFGL